MPKYIYKKLCEGRGRPTKFVQLDDGTLVPYKDYEKEHGKLPEVEGDEKSTAETPEAEPSVEPKKRLIFNREGIEHEAKVVEFPDNGVSYQTKSGSPIEKIVSLVDYGKGFEDVIAIVKGKGNKSYKNLLNIKDINPTPVLIPEQDLEQLTQIA